MKEYLNKLTDGTYKLVVLSDVIDGHDGLIEIPEGATAARLCEDVEFYKNDFGVFFSRTSGNWLNTISPRGVLMKNIVWQRAKQPEELPFVDDEMNKEWERVKSVQNNESINDQYAEIEQLRKEYKLKNDMNVDDYINSLRCADAKPNQTTINAMSEADASIADTLNERQSTYGSFEDVANTTQYLLQMLSTDAMSDVQLEALHMICSKLARIAHGDPNYKDNWHDIAGYATLVERSL